MTKPSMELFPEVPISTPATWDDVLRLASYEPAVRHAIKLVYEGCDREEALIVAVFMLYELKRTMFQAEIDRRASEPVDFVLGSGMSVRSKSSASDHSAVGSRGTGLRELSATWRREADKGEENAKLAFAEDLPRIATMSAGMALAIREKADELDAALSALPLDDGTTNSRRGDARGHSQSH